MTCPTGKVAYATRTAARQAAINYALRDLRNKGRGRVNTTYQCPHCGAWHRTSQVTGK